MKKKLAGLLALAMMTGGLVFPAEAAAATGETWVVASTSGVKVRKGAGSEATLGVLGLGSEITVTKTQKAGDTTWGYVSAAKAATGSWGTTTGGWVTLDPCCKGAPTKWVVTASSLNLRKKADVNSARLAQLPKDTKVTVTTIVKQGGYTWGAVAYAKAPNDEYFMREGWVALEYCKKG